jgi:hypothetical protein
MIGQRVRGDISERKEEIRSRQLSTLAVFQRKKRIADHFVWVTSELHRPNFQRSERFVKSTFAYLHRGLFRNNISGQI